MSGKYIVGGVAAAGVAYYLYENKKIQQELHQPKSWPETKYNQLKGDTVGAKIDSNLSTLQKKADKKSDEAKDWADEKSKDLKKWGDSKQKQASSWAAEKQKEGENYWKETGKPQVKEKISEAKGYLDKKVDAANREVGNNRAGTAVYLTNKDATYNDPNKSGILKAGDAYIDAVNSAAFAVHDTVYSIKDSIFGKSSKTDELKKEAEKTKKQAGSWFGDAFSKAQDKKEEAQKKSNSWFKFNDDTNQTVTDVSRGFGENASFWAKEEEEQAKLGTKLKEAKDGVVDTVSKAGESTLATLGSAKDILDKKSTEVADQANDATEKAKPWFGLKSVDQRDEEKLDKLIAEVSRGYGENATFFARESYDDIANKPVLIQELRDKASNNLKEAKANFDKTRTHWWSWASAKDKEVEKAAKEQWENAQVFYNDVEKRLVEGNAKFKDWTDSAISGTKKGLDYANEKTQDGLTGAQKWIRGEKK